MYSHITKLCEKLALTNWSINFFGDTSGDFDNFMERYYNNTSLLWAFRLINPRARVAAADIWRYSALYAFGGFYSDDDSTIPGDVEEVCLVLHISFIVN